MTFKRACAFAVAAWAALILSGCFVVSRNLPAGSGSFIDDRLVGAWQGIDSDSGEKDDVYLHFQQPEEGKPLRLIWIEDRNYQVYEVATMRIGNKNVFAAKILYPLDKVAEDGMPVGYYLGFYELAANGNEIVFHLLDAKKVGALIERGVVKGIKPPREYDMATLTGSPTELARFLASPEADAARSDEPARLHRLPPVKKK